MAAPINRDRFVAMLTERYPEIAAEIDECSRGLLHLEMAALARAAQAAMRDEEEPAIKGYFAFIDEEFRLATTEVKNAVCVSFLEYLSFDGRHGKRIGAREMLSPRLQAALRGLEQYNAELFRKRE